MPEGGVAGATFGGDSLAPGYESNPTHDHTYDGYVVLYSTGVGLVSGCCGNGYAQADAYVYTGTTETSAVDFPYIMVPMCSQVDF